MILQRPPSLLLFLLTFWATLHVAVSDNNTNATASVDPLEPSAGSPTEVGVHVVERFTPYESKTFVGPYHSILVGSGYRLMTSFRAFEFNDANAASTNMDCFFVSKDNGQWLSLSPQANTTAKRTDEHAFCVRRDMINDSSTFAVAQFQRELDGPVLVTSTQGNISTLIADAKSRGWIHFALVAFRVSLLKAWHTAPVLRFISEIQVAAAPTLNETDELCSPSTDGLVERRIEPGNYYARSLEKHVHKLCVTYVRRSVQDLDPKEEFATNVRFYDMSVWTFQACPLFSSIAAAYIGGHPVGEWYVGGYTSGRFRPGSGDNSELSERLLCLDKKRLVRDDDNTKSLNDPSAYAKRVYFDETPEDRNERLRVDYYDKDAWVFEEQPIDADEASKF